MRAFPYRVTARRCALTSVLIGVLHASIASAAPTTHTVTIEGMQFSPATLEVRPGDTVRWMNKDLFPHDVTATNRSFKSPEIAPDGSWTFKMMQKGEFRYFCSLHPPMKATVIVK